MTIVIVHILSPAAYGLMALAMMTIGLLSVLDELGLGSAIVQRRHVSAELIRQVYGLVIVFNLCLYGIVFFAAPYIADFFSEPRLTDITRILALQLPILSFAIIPNALLRRQMRFKGQSLVYFAATTSNSACTLVLALQGYGVWSLVGGSLCAVFVRVVGLNLIARYWCLPKFSFRGMLDVAVFGSLVTFDRLLWYILSQLPTLIIGRVLGKEILGFFSVASQLSSLPTQKISEILNQVGFSAFSRIQDDLAQVRAHLLRGARMLCFVGFPVFFGISSVAPELVTVLLGSKWAPAIFPLQILSLTGMIGLMQVAIKPAIVGVGRPDVGVVNLSVNGLFTLAALLVGVRWGLDGVCWAYLVVRPFRFLITLKLYLGVLKMSVRQFLWAMLPSFGGAAIMYVGVELIRAAVRTWLSLDAPRLALLVVVGVAIYAAFMWLFQRNACREMLVLLRSNSGAPTGQSVSAEV